MVVTCMLHPTTNLNIALQAPVKGEKGERGEVGERGNKGSRGEKGSKGNIGNRGQRGLTGEKVSVLFCHYGNL